LKKIATPFRVGLLVLASAGFLFIFLTFVTKGGLSDQEAISVFAYFRDASGLGKKSRIQIAGIPVGEVKEIVLEGTRARVNLRIRRDVGLKVDAMLSKRSESLLGDFVLDLVPGSPDADPMPDGGEIKRVIDRQGMDAVFASLDKITSDISAVTNSLKNVLGGEKGQGSMEQIVDNLVKLTSQVEQTVGESGEKLQRILDNVEAVTASVKHVTAGEEQTVREILVNVQFMTRDAREVAATVRQILSGTGQDDIKETMSSLKETLAKLDRSLANIETVTEKVKNGEGAIGKLVSDERLGQKVGETVEDVSDFASKLTQLKAEVSIKSEYLMAQGSAKNTLGLRLIPKPDKYYLLEFIDDPRGVVDTQVVTTNPPSAGEPVTQVQRISREALKFSAQFAKRYYFATLRFGIIESTGGIGSDLHVFNDHLTLKVDAFNFSVEELRYPRVRATLKVQAFDHLYATLGMDDILNRQVRDVGTNRLLTGRDIFFGAGVFFTDDDFKALLTIAGTPSP
jgi:phospholipid/cholesterol/gamma-HCH transport system substrate-binding protein